MRIGIVGCGTAGPAAACLLARAGHEVVMLERAAELRPVGAGLLIQPTGMAVLQRLGVLEQALALGHRIDRLSGRTASGRSVLQLRYGDLDASLFGLGMHRGALFSILLEAARSCERFRLNTGCECVQIERSETDVRVRDLQGREHGPFDLLIIADGARSALRHQIGPAHVRPPKPYDYGALWFVGESCDTTFDHTLSQVYRGTRHMIGFLPSGRASPGGPQTVSMFWSVRCREVERLREAGIDAWRRDALALAPHAAELISQVRSMDELLFASYFDFVARPCFNGRVVLLGDAAHAMSPQLGQGANLGLVDAATLAEALNGAQATDGSLSDALARYDGARRRHVRFYSLASRWLTPWFQSSMSWLSWPRDVLGLPVSRVAFVRRQMALSLVGVKDGLLSSRPIPRLVADCRLAVATPAGAALERGTSPTPATTGILSPSCPTPAATEG